MDARINFSINSNQDKYSVSPDGFIIPDRGRTQNANTRRTLVAGEIISGQSLVKIGNDGKVYYFTSSNQTNADLAIGFSLNGALSGNNIDIIIDGIIEDMQLESGKNYYASLNGAITTSVPTSGLLVLVGTAISSTELKIEIYPSIILA